MSGDNRNKKKAPARPPEERTEALVHKAMLKRGWLIPTTSEEVAAFEAEFDEKAVELPASLRDPYAVLDGEAATPRLFTGEPANTDICHSLARAAREGKEIPPEVEERMRQDRERAESESPDGTK